MGGRLRSAWQREDEALTPDLWPSFVDILATIIIVMVFVLLIFITAQSYLGRALEGRDQQLSSLRDRLGEVTRALQAENRVRQGLQQQLSNVGDQLKDVQRARAEVARSWLGLQVAQGGVQVRLRELEQQKEASAAQGLALEARLAEVLRQLEIIESVVTLQDRQQTEAQQTIATLERKLEVALAEKVEELSRYRSEFFGRMREVLAGRQDVVVVGDRFVFQSEVLFKQGSASIEPAGVQTLSDIATSLVTLSRDIPSDIPWLLQVEGHTDDVPIANQTYASNWELSTARAMAVVTFLTQRGVPQNRLMVSGLGEFQPISVGKTSEDRQRNRRIELRLTQR